MPLRISDASRDIPRVNKWADGVEDRLARIEALQREHAKSVKTLKATTAAVVTLPYSPTGVSASESGYIIDGVLYSEVTCSYTAPSPLGTFAGVYLVAKNYRGSAELVKIAEHTYSGAAGGSASFKVTLQRTGETVTLYFVPKNANEASPTPWSSAPSTTVVLDGNASAPNAPSGVAIGSAYTGIQLAWSDNAETNMLAYRVYRHTANNFAGATKIAQVPFTGGGTARYADVDNITSGTTYFYWITAVNTALQESSPSTVVSAAHGAATVQGAAQGISTLLNSQGSIVNGQIVQLTVTQNSNSSGSCTIQLSWSTTTVLRADGTSVSVTGSTATWTGLSANTTYYFYPCVRVSDGTMHFAKQSGPTGADPNTAPNLGPVALSAAQSNVDGYAAVYATPINVTTPATSGGSGSSGGGGVCVEEHEPVNVQGKGWVAIGTVLPGDFILGRDLANDRPVFRKVVRVEREFCSHWRKVEGHYLSPLERCWVDGRWQRAYEIESSVEEFFPGHKIKLTLEELPDDERNYCVGNLVVHNVQPPC